MNDEFFYACEDEIDISIIKEKTSYSITWEQESINLLKLKGSGMVVLKIPVSENEILRCKLYKDKLTVDGENVILRDGKIKSDIEKYMTHGMDRQEEIFDVYSGVGEVWITPVKSIYNEIEDLYRGGIEEHYHEEDDEED